MAARCRVCCGRLAATAGRYESTRRIVLATKRAPTPCSAVLPKRRGTRLSDTRSGRRRSRLVSPAGVLRRLGGRQTQLEQFDPVAIRLPTANPARVHETAQRRLEREAVTSPRMFVNLPQHQPPRPKRCSNGPKRTQSGGDENSCPAPGFVRYRRPSVAGIPWRGFRVTLARVSMGWSGTGRTRKRCTICARTNWVSSIAMPAPMQVRGPAPNGR